MIYCKFTRINLYCVPLISHILLICTSLLKYFSYPLMFTFTYLVKYAHCVPEGLVSHSYPEYILSPAQVLKWIPWHRSRALALQSLTPERTQDDHYTRKIHGSCAPFLALRGTTASHCIAPKA